jgi:ABC-type phosphate transport system substrate-binding protein
LRRISIISLVVTVALAVLAGPAFTFADQGFQVVVNSNVAGGQIPREALSLIFLKKAPRWGDGSLVAPVDQSLRSVVRRRFTKHVLGEPIISVQSFWHKQMVSGVQPPPVKSSDEEVLAYVASTPGAIGYVSSGAPLPDGVRSLSVID